MCGESPEALSSIGLGRHSVVGFRPQDGGGNKVEWSAPCTGKMRHDGADADWNR